jgi:hypothetical protein
MTDEERPEDEDEQLGVFAVYSADIIEPLIADQQARFGGVLAPYLGVRSLTERDEDEDYEEGRSIDGHDDEELYEMGRCLANAILFASRHEEYFDGWQVIVGYALAPENDEPCAHSWVVDPDGHAWDVTWSKVADVTYVGLPLRRTE